MAYIKKEPIVEFITKGLNNPDKTKAFGYDAIEILTEIEFSPTADVAPKSEVERLENTYRRAIRKIDNKTITAIRKADKEELMSKRVSKNVKCPFYRKHDGGKIVCEGVSDNNTLHLVFPDPMARARYMKTKCDRIEACQSCLIHKILYEKWGMYDE